MSALSMRQAAAPHLVAVVESDDPDARERSGRLLAAAGFTVADDGDLVVLLLSSPLGDRLAAIEAAGRKRPGAAIVSTMPADARGSELRSALRAGADGVMLDDRIDAVLVPTVRAVASGQLAVPQRLRRELAPPALSYREKEVMSLVVRGCTNRQIADALFVTESTVKTHLASAFGKLDAHSRSEAAALILDHDGGYGVDVVSPLGT